MAEGRAGSCLQICILHIRTTVDSNSFVVEYYSHPSNHSATIYCVEASRIYQLFGICTDPAAICEGMAHPTLLPSHVGVTRAAVGLTCKVVSVLAVEVGNEFHVAAQCA